MSLGLLRQRCTIQRSTQANTDGIIERTWGNLATGVPCLIQEGSGRTGSGSGGVKTGPEGNALEYDATCFLPPNTDVKPRRTSDEPDRIVQTTPATTTVYSVVLVVDKSGFAHHDTAYLKRLPGA